MATKSGKSKSKDTPLMRQYNEIKTKYPDTLLLFRVGDFYETFNDDRKFEKKDLIYLNNKEHNPKHFATCHAPWSSVHINVDGNLFPCMAVAMGNVKITKLAEIIFSGKFKKFKDIIRKKGTINGCNRCGWLKAKQI